MGDAGTYDETVASLEAIVERCATSGDRAGYFAAMYLAVTRTVRRRSVDGRFADAARMERFVTGFARRYLDAEVAWRAVQPCSARGRPRSTSPAAGARSCSSTCSSG